MIELDYSKYHLSKNPFPENAFIKVDSNDPRINGSIFCTEVFFEETNDLKQKLGTKSNVIYLLGPGWERGTGKSAILVNAWKNLNSNDNIVNIYLKCEKYAPYNNPSGFAKGIIIELHKRNILWKILSIILNNYVEDVQPLFPKISSLTTLFNTFKEYHQKLPFTRYTHISDPTNFSFNISNSTYEKWGLEKSICKKWLDIYLTSPSQFQDTLEKIPRKNAIRYYNFFINLLKLTGLEHCFIFLDQFEDALMIVSNPKIEEFCLGMRNLLESGTGFTTITVTLHPDSYTKLASGGKTLTQLAPLDTIHMISIMTLKNRTELVVPLSQSYLNEFRTSEPIYTTYPFTEDALQLICDIEGGNIRQILQRLYHCIQIGLKKDLSEITAKTICESPREFTGKELIQS